MKPTMGLIVIYTEVDGTDCAAIVTGVNPQSPFTVNLHVFLPLGGTESRNSVPFVDETANEMGCWDWPARVQAETPQREQGDSMDLRTAEKRIAALEKDAHTPFDFSGLLSRVEALERQRVTPIPPIPPAPSALTGSVSGPGLHVVETVTLPQAAAEVETHG